MIDAVVTASHPANNAAEVTGAIATTDGSLVNEFDAYNIITVASEFITTFEFSQDANELGVVWQIDNFQAFNAGQNVTLGNLTRIDLQPVGVDDLTDIVIQAGDTFWAGLSADEQQAYIDNNYAAGDFNDPGNTVITSNEDLDFTILLQGVAFGDLSNENFVGIS
jgi:hypothetical protein